MATGEGSPKLAAGLQSLSVNLIGYESNAQFVNPLTLLWNQVVDETWVCEMGAQIGLTQSSFTYTNGVQVEAYEDHVSFKQSGSPLGASNTLAAEIASRYVDAFGSANWMAVSIEFLGAIPISSLAEFADLEMWTRLAGQLTINGVQPRFGTNVFYFSPDKRLRVELNLDPRSDPTSLTCFGWVYRELSGISDQAQSELQTMLTDWESDWRECAPRDGDLDDHPRPTRRRRQGGGPGPRHAGEDVR